MKIKEFEALNLKDCLGQVRSELGPEAVILETRKAKKGGILGLGARDSVRIIAGTGIMVQDESPRRTVFGRPPGIERAASPNLIEARQGESNRSVRANKSEDVINPVGRSTARRPAPDIAAFLAHHAAVTAAPEYGAPATGDSYTNSKLANLEREMRAIRATLSTLGKTTTIEGTCGAGNRFPELRQLLIDSDVSAELAESLVAGIPDLGGLDPGLQHAMSMRALRDAMLAQIKVADSEASSTSATKVVALVGPTGVGKTTTIAKLAAHHALILKQRVGLITMDTYRIAAVEQLKSYSQIIGIPVEVAHSQADIGPALERLRDCELVLIDTAGRSHRNAMQVNELRSLVEASACETHLVLAASTRERDILDQIERFSDIGIDRLLFTKLDETTTYGTLYNVAARTSLPLSYFAAGQKVPEDLETATAARLIDRILVTKAMGA